MKSRPNILFIMADQLAAGALAAYGHKLVRTPNLDRIAAQGAVFENAYSPNPICASSRFAMMSGQRSTGVTIFLASDASAYITRWIVRHAHSALAHHG